MVVNEWIHVIAKFFILAGIILGTWLPPPGILLRHLWD
jgi:hypothetical protein